MSSIGGRYYLSGNIAIYYFANFGDVRFEVAHTHFGAQMTGSWLLRPEYPWRGLR